MLSTDPEEKEKAAFVKIQLFNRNASWFLLLIIFPYFIKIGCKKWSNTNRNCETNGMSSLRQNDFLKHSKTVSFNNLLIHTCNHSFIHSFIHSFSFIDGFVSNWTVKRIMRESTFALRSLVSSARPFSEVFTYRYRS